MTKKQELQQQLLERLDFTRETEEEELLEILDRIIRERSSTEYIGVAEKLRLRREVFNSLRRMDVLQELLEDEDITEIMVNGAENIFIERCGRLTRFEGSFESERKLADVVQQMASGVNRVVNEANPIVDTRLPESGYRVNIILPPVALNGPVVTIRKFPKETMTIDRLIALGSLTEEAAEFLRKLVRARYNIFISGGTGSGKTTFLNVLSNYIPPEERVVTIEDSAELQLLGLPNLVRLEVRNATTGGAKSVTIRDLIRASLRMRPDRIIVGEIRGAEALDMLQAMNTGHDGSLSTGHANSAADMLSRIETMVLQGAELPLQAIRGQIASAVDVIVHLGRLRDKSRKVLEISEVLGCRDGEVQLSSLYEFCEDGKGTEELVSGKLSATGTELVNMRKMKHAGLQ